MAGTLAAEALPLGGRGTAMGALAGALLIGWRCLLPATRCWAGVDSRAELGLLLGMRSLAGEAEGGAPAVAVEGRCSCWGLPLRLFCLLPARGSRAGDLLRVVRGGMGGCDSAGVHAPGSPNKRPFASSPADQTNVCTSRKCRWGTGGKGKEAPEILQST